MRKLLTSATRPSASTRKVTSRFTGSMAFSAGNRPRAAHALIAPNEFLRVQGFIDVSQGLRKQARVDIAQRRFKAVGQPFHPNPEERLPAWLIQQNARQIRGRIPREALRQ